MHSTNSTDRSGTAGTVPGTVWNVGTFLERIPERWNAFGTFFGMRSGTFVERTWNAFRNVGTHGTLVVTFSESRPGTTASSRYRGGG